MDNDLYSSSSTLYISPSSQSESSLDDLIKSSSYSSLSPEENDYDYDHQNKGLPEFLDSTVTLEEWIDMEEEYRDTIEDYLDETALKMCQKTFTSTMIDELHDHLFQSGVMQEWLDESMEEEFFDWIRIVIADVMQSLHIPPREANQYKTISLEESDIESTINWLATMPVQKQRSPEWYAIRHGLFSASNLWKLFSTPGNYNSLLYEKCKDVNKIDGLNTSSYEGDLLSPGSRNWGIKYEPVSVMVYEHKYNTTVNTNYGCIPHESLPMGASPDGINIKKGHPKYGHMVEVKNIYNRQMDGIPSTEYWTQMQIQMTTCRLEFCDFLETRFKEYLTSSEFHNDTEHEYKGVILFFVPNDTNQGQSHFVYVPLEIGKDKKAMDIWFEETRKEKEGYFLYNISYWYLEEMYCTEVERNDWWFQKTIPTIKDSWKTVLRERKEGYEHRAPQKRISAQEKSMQINITMNPVPVTNPSNPPLIIVEKIQHPNRIQF
jgi:hypothetical protein